MKFVRYNWFAFSILFFMATMLLYGCSLDPFRSMKEKKQSKSFDSQATAGIVDAKNLKPYLMVPGRIMDIEPSEEDRYLLTVWENPSLILQTPDDIPVNVSLWNLEHLSPFAEKSEELGSIDSILSSVWNDEENRLFIADKDSRRPHNLRGFRKSNVRALALDSPLNDQVALLSEENDDQNLRLSPKAHWIACEDRNHVWRLIKRTDQRLVQFPELTVKTDQGEQQYIVSDILAFSQKNDLVATTISVKTVSVQDEKSLFNENFNANGFGKAYSNEQFFKKQSFPIEENKGQHLNRPVSNHFISRGQNDSDEQEGQYDLIVIWDLQVVDQAEWKKEMEPLKAIEVSRFNVRKGIDSNKCAFSPNGTMFAVRSKSKYIGIWGAASGRLLMELGEHQQPIHSMKFDSNNHYLVVGTGENSARLVLWDVRQGKLLRIYQEPDANIKQITAVAFSKNNKKIYFGTENGFVKIWNLQK